MKRFSGMIRAFALVMVMVCVLCVNSFAICETVNVGSSTRQIRLRADGNKAYNYVTVCNVGIRQRNGSYRYNNVQVYDQYGNSYFLQANRSCQFKLRKGETRTIYISPRGGGTNVVVSGGAYRV